MDLVAKDQELMVTIHIQKRANNEYLPFYPIFAILPPYFYACPDFRFGCDLEFHDP